MLINSSFFFKNWNDFGYFENSSEKD